MIDRALPANRFTRLLPLLAILLLPALPALAEEPITRIELRNGDTISGELLKMEGGKLHVATAWGGTLEIDSAAVLTLTHSAQAVVEYGEGEQGEGTLSFDQGVPQLDGQSLDALTAINPPVVPPVVWSLALSLGANLQRGNSEQTALHLGVDATRTTAIGTLTLKLSAQEADEGEVTTASNTYFGAQYDRNLSERTFAYGKVDFLEDSFKDLDLRTVVSVGMGYQAIEREGLNLKVQGGLAWLSENFILAEDQDELTVEVGYTLEAAVGSWGTFSERLLARPSFEDDSYQFRFENTLRTTLTTDWALKLSAVLDYDSEPPPGVEKDDLLFIAALEYAISR